VRRGGSWCRARNSRLVLEQPGLKHDPPRSCLCRASTERSCTKTLSLPRFGLYSRLLATIRVNPELTGKLLFGPRKIVTIFSIRSVTRSFTLDSLTANLTATALNKGRR
jgi:hypothetical protein